MSGLSNPAKIISIAAVYMASLLLYILTLIYLNPSFGFFCWRFDHVLIPFLWAVFYFFTRRTDNPLFISLCFAVTLLVCGAVLSEIWKLGVSARSALAGLLPHSDASAYTEGAMSLLNRGSLTMWASRRPLATSWLSLNMALTGENLKRALALMTLLGSLGIALTAGVLRGSLGAPSAWLAHSLLFFYYRAFIGTTLSEHAGFFFGCVGFSLLWKAAFRRGDILSWSAGILVQTVGLVARAGTFFILPFLIVCDALRSSNPKRRALRRFLAAVTAVLLVFALNGAVLRAAGYPEAAFGNFAPTLYGLLHGGNWTQVYSDHPEIKALNDAEGNRRIYALSFERLRERPSSLIKGAVRVYKSFFLSPQGAYSFVVSSAALSFDFHNLTIAQKRGLRELKDEFLSSEPWQIYYASAALLWFAAASLLALCGVIRLFIEKAWYRRFVLAAEFGILASVPFLPPWDAPLMRVYIASAPFFVILPAITLSKRAGRDAAVPDGSSSRLLETCSALLFLGMVLFPIGAGLNADKLKRRIPNPSEGLDVVKVLDGGYVKSSETSVIERFMGQNELLAEALLDDRIRAFKKIPPGSAIGIGCFPDGSACYVYWSGAYGLKAGEWAEVRATGDSFLKELIF